MIFKSLELQDFGIYAGRQRLDLEAKRNRPVLLAGGTNGAGKTTLLESFTLFLHGLRALDARVSQEAYEAHIRSRFHVAPNENAAEECAITLAFDHVQSGRSSDYVVSRRWRRTSSGSVKEALSLALDGAEIDDLSDASRQDFLDSLLPPGLAGFFLFDGEQIQALADDEKGEYLADAVKRLLGLDLIDRLQVDLRRSPGRSTSKEDDELERSVNEAERQTVDAKEQVALAKETRAMLQAEQDQLDRRLGRARERLRARGGHPRRRTRQAGEGSPEGGRRGHRCRGAAPGSYRRAASLRDRPAAGRRRCRAAGSRAGCRGGRSHRPQDQGGVLRAQIGAADEVGEAGDLHRTKAARGQFGVSGTTAPRGERSRARRHAGATGRRSRRGPRRRVQAREAPEARPGNERADGPPAEGGARGRRAGTSGRRPAGSRVSARRAVERKGTPR